LPQQTDKTILPARRKPLNGAFLQQSPASGCPQGAKHLDQGIDLI
jgi:hypothetical protein